MRRIYLAVVCLLMMGVAATARAAPNLLDLKVEYSADSVIGSGDNTKSGHLWRKPGALRHEMTENGQTQTVIVSLDRNMAWLLLPAFKLALGTDLDGLTQLSGAPAVLGVVERLNPVSVGTETIEGLRATKYRVQMKDTDAGQFDGFVWSTTQGVVLKIDGAGEQNGHRGTIHLLFRNVRVGPQDSGLFEPPAGYKQVTVGPAEVAAMLKTMEQFQRFHGGAPAPAQ